MRGSNLFIIILILVNLIGHVLITPLLDGSTYIFEWFFVILLMILSVVLFYGLDNRKMWAWALLSLYFAVSLLNMAYLYFNTSSYLLILITVASALGFIVAVTSTKYEPKVEVYHVKEEPIIVEEIKPRKADLVGSATGNTYHNPDCRFAKRINDKVHFNSEAEARKKGYKAHNCV